MGSATASKAASVQAKFVPVREVTEDHVLSLYSATAPGKREYRAVLEVSGLNYALKSEMEQRSINDVFRLFLAGLSHSLQVIVRIFPLDIERHLRQFHLDHRHPIFMQPALQDYLERWCDLSDSYVQWWQAFTQSRSLLERHFYIIVPADSLSKQELGIVSLFKARSGQTLRAKDALERAKQQLNLRCSEIARQLSGLGLEVRRLAKNEIVQLEYTTLTPERARTCPLHEAYVQGVGHLVQRADLAGGQSGTRSASNGQAVRPLSVPTKKQKPSRKKKAAEDILGWPDLVDLLSPGGVQLSSDSLYMEMEHNRVLALRGLPRYVPPGWLNPLLVECDEPMDIVFFFDPRENGAMIHTYQRRLYEMESSNIIDKDKGRKDHDRAVVHGDVEDLIGRLASGEERMVDVSMYIRLRAPSKRELNTRAARVQSVCNSMLLQMRPCLFEQDKGFMTCLPHGRNELRSTDNGVFTLPATVASTFFMLLSNTLADRDGTLEGITDGQEPILFDRWAPQWRNAHRILVGPTGSGKSMKIKEDILRLDLQYNHPLRILPSGAQQIKVGLQQIIVDIEGEFLGTCQKRGGQWIRLSPGSLHHINIFDLPSRHDPSRGDVLADQIQFIHGAIAMMLAEPSLGGSGALSGAEKALLDTALYSCYKECGITSDPATHRRQPPVLSDLHRILEKQVCGPDPTGLAHRLRRYVTGSLRGLFSGHTNVSFNAPLVVLDIRDLDLELRPIAIYLITHLIWAMSFGSTTPRHFVLDEMQSLYRYPEGRKMIEELFQRGRKYFLSITAAIQYPNMLKDSNLVANCQMLIIMAQEAASIDAVAEFAHLSPPEVALVRKCRKGDGVLVIGDKRFFVHFSATDAEYRIATTDPRDRARYEQEGVVVEPPPSQFTASQTRYLDQPTADLPPVDAAIEDTSSTDRLTPVERQQRGSRSRPLEVA